MTRKIVILLGNPGAGKGTQAKEITRRLNIPQISTGDMLREAMARQNGLGSEARKRMDSGFLVNDETVNSIVAQRIVKEDCRKGFILDGYPRTVSQAETFSRELRPDDRFWVIEIAADPAHVMSRLLGRLMCPTCNEIYNVHSRVPKVDRLCDKCGTALVQRADDVEEKIHERFLHYRAKTDPLVDYYKRTGRFHRIDGRPPAAEVTRRLMALIDGEELEGHMEPIKVRKGTIA